MIIDNAGTYTLRYTATDDCGKTTTVDRELVVQEVIPEASWANGTDEEIVAMVMAADEGKIDLTDYWSVGDERVVHLSAMEATGVGESHAEQDVTFVLANVGGKTLDTPTQSGRTECSFIVVQKDCLNEQGYMDNERSNSKGWDRCKRRTWCNQVYYNAIPSTLRPIFKQVVNKTANKGLDASEEVSSTDFFALPAEYEVFGSYSYSNSTYESGLSRFELYTDITYRIKHRNGSTVRWWVRSPNRNGSDRYCGVTDGGTTETGNYANGSLSLSPFGAI